MKQTCWMAGLLLCLTACASAGAFDVNTDMGFGANPNGVWSCGYVVGGDTALYNVPLFLTGDTTGLNVWSKDGETDPYGNIAKNTNAYDLGNQTWPNGMRWFAGKTHMMTPSGGAAGGRVTAIRFTAPEAGLYDIDVDFLKASTGEISTDLQVLVGGTSVMSKRVNSADPAAAYDGLSVQLSAGSTVDLLAIPVAGSGDWDGGFSITQVDAVITQVPEPITLSLLALGGLALRRKC